MGKKTRLNHPLSWEEKKRLKEAQGQFYRKNYFYHGRGSGKSYFSNIYPGLNEEKIYQGIMGAINQMKDKHKPLRLPTKKEIKSYINNYHEQSHQRRHRSQD